MLPLEEEPEADLPEELPDFFDEAEPADFEEDPELLLAVEAFPEEALFDPLFEAPELLPAEAPLLFVLPDVLPVADLELADFDEDDPPDFFDEDAVRLEPLLDLELPELDLDPPVFEPLALLLPDAPLELDAELDLPEVEPDFEDVERDPDADDVPDFEPADERVEDEPDFPPLAFPDDPLAFELVLPSTPTVLATAVTVPAAAPAAAPCTISPTTSFAAS